MAESKLISSMKDVQSPTNGLSNTRTKIDELIKCISYSSEITITGPAIVGKTQHPGIYLFQFIVNTALTEAGGFTFEMQILDVPVTGTVTIAARPLTDIDDVATTSLTKGFHEIVLFNTGTNEVPVYKAYLVR